MVWVPVCQGGSQEHSGYMALGQKSILSSMLSLEQLIAEYKNKIMLQIDSSLESFQQSALRIS